jgi:hypothetical protein
MYVPEESHSGILLMNQSNKDRNPSAENEEERPLIKENAGQPNTHPTQSGERVSQGLAGVRKVARDNKEMKFTALLHHLTVDLLRESFYSLNRGMPREISVNYISGARMESTRPSPSAGSISRRKTGSRDPSRSRPWRTRSCSGRWSKY